MELHAECMRNGTERWQSCRACNLDPRATATLKPQVFKFPSFGHNKPILNNKSRKCANQLKALSSVMQTTRCGAVVAVVVEEKGKQNRWIKSMSKSLHEDGVAID